MGMASTVFLKFPTSSKKSKGVLQSLYYTKNVSQGKDKTALQVTVEISTEKSSLTGIKLTYFNLETSCFFILKKVGNINNDPNYFKVQYDLSYGGCDELKLYSQNSTDFYNSLLRTTYCKEEPMENAMLLDENKNILAQFKFDAPKSSSSQMYGDEEDCFLTTACTKYKGLPDDCDELQKLRTFRDDYMLKRPEGKAMVKEYYRIAPAIVKKLAIDKNEEVYDFIYDELVTKCINFINQGEHDMAMYYYKSFTEELQRTVMT